MFCDCYSLSNLDTSNFDTSNVTNMAEMFKSCISLAEFRVERFNVYKVVSMREMYFNCRYAIRVDMSSWEVGSLAVSNIRSKNAKELIEIASRGLNDAAANRIKDLALRDIKASRYDEIAYIISRLKQGESQVLTIGGKKIQLTSL